MVYVSVTGLQLKSLLHLPRFYWHATRAFRQARTADGLLFADARTLEQFHHTLTVWRDRASMHSYLRAGAHRKAMRAFPSIATGMVYGYESEQVPDWEAALAEWHQHGREVG